MERFSPLTFLRQSPPPTLATQPARGYIYATSMALVTDARFALLREAALELLASSTITRYAREARRLAADSGLARELHGTPERHAHARSRVLHLLAEVADHPLRIPAEFEAALLLCALVSADPRASRDVLQRASESASPWLRSLAARLATPSPATPCSSPNAGLPHAV